MVRKKIITIYSFIKIVLSEFVADNIFKYSASLAYYTLFSLVPMLFIIITVCSTLFGSDAIQGQLYSQINELVGNDAALQIQEAIKNIHLSNDSWGTSVLSIVILLIGATAIFSEIQDSLNKIWGLKIKTKKIWWKLLVDRFISFSLIISVGFVLMVSLAINSVVMVVGTKLSYLLYGSNTYLLPIIQNIISFATIVFLFAIIFKTLPDAKIKWRDVIFGAVITAILFTIGKFAIGYYLGTTKIASLYGTAATVIIILVWTYYSSIILYLGAVCTKVYAKLYGGKILPNEYATFIKVEEIEVNNIKLNEVTN